MRDLDAIRRKPEAKTLKAFALRVGVRQIWELSGEKHTGRQTYRQTDSKQ